jgi:hypothetical protein
MADQVQLVRARANRGRQESTARWGTRSADLVHADCFASVTESCA